MSTDLQWMQLALDEARKGTALTSPNPTVGCVLVKDNQLLSSGHHIYDNLDHAEIVALKQASTTAQGSTAYVTLEPCSHQGRTGPCADALIAAKVKRVVVATTDPNPQVSGNGIGKLRNAGIEVAIGPGQQEARQLNEAFAKSITIGQPFVTLKAALSVDGKLAPPPEQRQSNQPHWLTGPTARADVQQLRHSRDAILTGIGTVLADDPTLTDRTNQPRRRPLLRIILDSNLRTPLNSKLVQSSNNDLLILTTETAPASTQQALEEAGAIIHRLLNLQDLNSVLNHLAHLKLLSVLLEAGNQLNGAFLQQDLVDKLILYYAPTELGNEALPFAQGIPSPFLLEQKLQQLTKTEIADDTKVSGYLHYPWK